MSNPVHNPERKIRLIEDLSLQQGSSSGTSFEGVGGNFFWLKYNLVRPDCCRLSLEVQEILGFPQPQVPDVMYHVDVPGDRWCGAICHDPEDYQQLTTSVFRQGAGDRLRSLRVLLNPQSHSPSTVHSWTESLLKNVRLAKCLHQLARPMESQKGYLFQGCYKSYLVEADCYFWTFSCSIHLNLGGGKYPCRNGCVVTPQQLP